MADLLRRRAAGAAERRLAPGLAGWYTLAAQSARGNLSSRRALTIRNGRKWVPALEAVRSQARASASSRGVAGTRRGNAAAMRRRARSPSRRLIAARLSGVR